MTALTTDKSQKVRFLKFDLRPLAASVKAIKGGLAMCITSGTGAGYYCPADPTKIGRIVGRFEETVDNTSGAAGAVSANVEFFEERRVDLMVNDTGTAIAVGGREGLCYTLDDQTVTGAATGQIAGIVYDLTSDATGVWVEGLLQSAPNIQSGTSTLVTGTKTISAALNANSRIFITMKDPGAGAITGFAGFDVPNANRNVGAGTFVVNAIDDTKATIAAAVCTFDWLVLN
jgi:hypothetical protein